MTRKSYLTVTNTAILNEACCPIAEAFHSPPYLVGSCTERPDFRDVDLRVILEDSEFDDLFSGREALWSLACLTIGRHLSTTTGLPIDFQIQRMTEANENHPTTRRHPMGLLPFSFAGGGDAARFDGAAHR